MEFNGMNVDVVLVLSVEGLTLNKLLLNGVIALLQI
jgi:hypothetical protein